MGHCKFLVWVDRLHFDFLRISVFLYYMYMYNGADRRKFWFRERNRQRNMFVTPVPGIYPIFAAIDLDTTETDLDQRQAVAILLIFYYYSIVDFILVENKLFLTNVIVYFTFRVVFIFPKALFLHIILVRCSKLFRSFYIFVSTLFWDCKIKMKSKKWSIGVTHTFLHKNDLSTKIKIEQFRLSGARRSTFPGCAQSLSIVPTVVRILSSGTSPSVTQSSRRARPRGPSASWTAVPGRTSPWPQKVWKSHREMSGS